MILRTSIIALCLLSGTLFAQKKEELILGLADGHFNKQEFYLAAQEYSEVMDKDSSNAYITYQLAECYRSTYDFNKAEMCYKVVSIRYKLMYPYARFWWAVCVMENARYEEAIKHFEQFRAEFTEGDIEAELYREKALQEIDNCKKMAEESKQVKVHMHGFKCLPKPINSTEGEYAPVIFENDTFLLITSARKGSVGGHKDNSMGGILCDMYRFKKTNDSTWHTVHHNHHDEFNRLNTSFNESSGSLTADKKSFYFARCDEKIGKEYNCAIYVSHNHGGKWDKGVRLNDNINMPGEWNSNPSISGDGNFLFFVSKRPGGLGMQDIWYAISDGSGNFTLPINLGPHINTPLTEMSPSYYSDLKVLFFSSNGHADGQGGLDIFMSRESDNFQKVINLGKPFNSSRDDFYFILGDKKGYLVSNRSGGVGYDDLYMFDIDSRKDIVNSILGVK